MFEDRRLEWKQPVKREDADRLEHTCMINKHKLEFDEMSLQLENQERIKSLQMEEDDRNAAREERVIAKEKCVKMLSLMDKLANKLSKSTFNFYCVGTLVGVQNLEWATGFKFYFST